MKKVSTFLRVDMFLVDVFDFVKAAIENKPAKTLGLRFTEYLAMLDERKANAERIAREMSSAK